MRESERKSKREKERAGDREGGREREWKSGRGRAEEVEGVRGR